MYSEKNVLQLINDLDIPMRTDIQQTLNFNTYAPLNNLKRQAITWVRTLTDEIIQKTSSNSIIVIADINEYRPNLANYIWVENPHRTFFRIIHELFENEDYDNKTNHIESSAVVISDKIGNNVYIGHQSFIDEEVVLADNVIVMHNVTIQGKVEIGEGSVIESGAKIGVCGFGHYWDEEGHPITVPHLGGVKIGKFVKIGANNTITRGCLGDTIIGDYVKCDNLVHIAHNDIIGEGGMFTACVEISGSVTTGKNIWVGPGTTINEGLTIADDAFIGIGTNIIKDVAQGSLVYGNPGKEKGAKK